MLFSILLIAIVLSTGSWSSPYNHQVTYATPYIPVTPTESTSNAPIVFLYDDEVIRACVDSPSPYTIDLSDSTVADLSIEMLVSNDVATVDALEISMEATESIHTLMCFTIAKQPCEPSNIAIANTSSYLNIRDLPSVEGTIVGKLYQGSAALLLEQTEDWSYIQSGTVTGYVKSEYLIFHLSYDELTTYATITATTQSDALNVRADASTESNRIDVIYKGATYPLVDQKEDWIQLRLNNNGRTGFVKCDYVDLTIAFSEAISIEEERKSLVKASPSDTVKNSKQTTDASCDEVLLLASLVHAEAGNQCYEGKLAVANVVLNRVKSSVFPNSIEHVIYQNGQFTVARNGSLKKYLSQLSTNPSSSQQNSIQAAKDALSGNNNIGSRLYFNRYNKSLAQRHSSKGYQIQDHLFW